MYTIVKVSVFDYVLQRITVEFLGKFSFLEDFFRILQIPPPSIHKPKKRNKGGICSQPVEEPGQNCRNLTKRKTYRKNKNFLRGNPFVCVRLNVPPVSTIPMLSFQFILLFLSKESFLSSSLKTIFSMCS